MRKLALLLAVLAVSLTASAQFEEGKKYVGVSATGLDLNYSGKNDLSIGMEARGGYFLFDNIMATGSLKYQNNGKAPDSFSVGVGGRYYIIQNGIFLGATASRPIRNTMFWAMVAFFAVWALGGLLIPAGGCAALHLLMAAYFAHLLVRTVGLSLDYPKYILIFA